MTRCQSLKEALNASVGYERKGIVLLWLKPQQKKIVMAYFVERKSSVVLWWQFSTDSIASLRLQDSVWIQDDTDFYDGS